MSTIQAESFACEVLRDYLLRKLPAKVAEVNATRAAVLKAARVSPYAVTDDIEAGADVDAESPVALDTGTRTALEVAGDFTLDAPAGLAASVETIGSATRFIISATAAPVEGTPSVVSLAPGMANRAFGWGEGGKTIIRSALVAPDDDGVHNGHPSGMRFGQGGSFQVVLGKRSTAPVANIRRDMHVIDIATEIVTCEPTQDIEAAREYCEAAIRCVREVLAEDRTLDGQAQLVEWPSMMFTPHTMQFEGAVSALLAVANMTLRVRLFERS